MRFLVESLIYIRNIYAFAFRDTPVHFETWSRQPPRQLGQERGERYVTLWAHAVTEARPPRED